MDKNTKSMLALPAVRFAPFLAAGLLVEYFTGCGILVIPAIAVLVFSLIKHKKAALPAAAFIAGMISMSVFINAYVAPMLEYGGQTVHSVMLIKDIADESQDISRVTAIADINGTMASVRVTGNFTAEAGDIVEADVKYSLPNEKYRSAEFANGIFLYGTAENITVCSYGRFSIGRFIYLIRRNCISRVKRAFSGDEQAIVRSMMFGDDASVSVKLREALCVSGAAHYTAVSGTHLTIIAAVMMELFLERRKIRASVISVLLILASAAFFGCSLSVLRSVMMLAIYYAAPIFERKTESLNTLCASASAIMLCSPSAILDAGFLMSVLGVFGAAVVSPRICKYILPKVHGRFIRKTAQALVVSFCAVVCTSPVSIAAFGGVSLVGVFVSVLLIPFITAGMVLIFLYGLTGMGFVAVAAFPFVKVIAAVPMFVGQFRSLWLAMDFKGAVYIAVLSVLMLAAAAFFSEETAVLCSRMFALLTAFSLAMPLYSRACRHEVVFSCNGSSAAAAVCIEDEAYVLISGSGVGIARNAADSLRRNGVTHIKCISAPNADLAGTLSVAELAEIFGADEVVTSDFAAPHFETMLPSAAIFIGTGEIDVSGMAIASAKINTPCSADVVLYYGRAGKITESGSGTAVYFSPSREELPENGVNISVDKNYCIIPEKYDTVTLR